MDDKRFDPDDMLANEYPDTLPTLDDDKPEPKKEPEPSTTIAKDHRSMLREEDEAKVNIDEENDENEQASIEKKSIYEDLTRKEHFFSKAKLEASDDFAKEMEKKKEWEHEQREKFIEEEKRAEKAEMVRELKSGQRYGTAFNYEEFEALEGGVDLHGKNTVTLSDDMAMQLRRKITQRGAMKKEEEEAESDERVRKGILSAIATEIVLAFIFIPTQIFILLPIVKFIFIAISVMLAILSIVLISMSGNLAEKHRVPKKQQLLFLCASVLPGAILRVALATGIANLLNGIPVAGAYIGYCVGAAIGGAIHYAYLGHYNITLGPATSIINSVVTVILLIIPNLITGNVEQPMDQKEQFGLAVYLIEGVFVIIVDEIIFALHQNRIEKQK